MKHTTALWGSLALLSARNDSSILERCIQSAVTTMWGIPLAGSRISLPILHRSSSFRSYAFFSHSLVILYHTLSALSSLYYIAFWFGGRERNRTPPNWWIPLSILSNDIQTHGASTISDPVMPVRNERFASPFSFSTYIIPNLAAKVKGLFKFIQYKFSSSFRARATALRKSLTRVRAASSRLSRFFREGLA